VTGANSGIGRAIAISLGNAGANVVVDYVTKPEDAEAVALQIRSAGPRAMTLRADVGDEAQVQAMFAEAVREFGTLDILVNNAGMERNAPFHEMTAMQWDAVMNVNLRGAFLMRIRVNSIAPGAIRTPINTAAWATPEAYAELMKLVPYKRIGEVEDIGRAAV
jgi:glucose 1-dehydrogenase